MNNIDKIKNDALKLRVMTANVLRFEDKMNFHKDDFIEAYRRFFGKYNCDIVCMQEYESSVNKDISLSIDNEVFNHWYSVYNNLKCGTENHCAVATKIKFDEFDNVKIDDNYNINRGYLTLNGKRICVCNAHLESATDGEQIRQNQIKEIIRLIENEEYVILTADFNTEDFSLFTNPDSKKTYNLANRGFFGDFWSWDWFGEYDRNSAQRIDNIIVSKNITIDNVVMTETLTSDHHFLVADLTIK